VKPIPSILISSSNILPERISGTGDQLSRLKPDQVVEATVVKQVSTRRARLMLQGKTVTAKTFTPLQEGETLRLQVSRAGSQPVFKLLGKTAGELIRAFARSWNASGRGGPFDLLFKDLNAFRAAGTGQAIEQAESRLSPVLQLLKSAALRPGHIDADHLRQWVQRSGLTWEHQLKSAVFDPSSVDPSKMQQMSGRDLKALSMTLMETLKADDAAVFRLLGDFVDGLQHLQLINRHGMEHLGRLVLPLPFMQGDETLFGQMLVDGGGNENRQKSGENRWVRVALLLEMTQLGHLRADVSVLDREISATLTVGSEDTQSFVNRHLSKFRDSLQRHGYHVTSLGCNVLPSEQLAAMSLVDQVITCPEGLLNIVV